MEQELTEDMEQRHRDIIRENYVQLIEAITPDVDGAVIGLYQKRIISDHMREDILVKKPPSKKTEALLDLIVTRGPNAYKALYECAKETELFDAVEILSKGEPI